MSSRQLDFVQKRRSTRIYNVIPLSIQGLDAFHAPFLEEVSTLTVNCHGCRYRSRYEVIQGDVVHLELKQSREGSATYSCKAQVKWVQRLVTKESRFEIAVELISPGNIWGIVSAPEDWFPTQAPRGIEQESSRQKQPQAAGIEREVIPIRNEASAHLSHPHRDDPATAMAGSLDQHMAGFGNQIQTMISQTAAATFAEERERFMGEFRTQLQNEAKVTLERVFSNSKQELIGRMAKDLQAAHEAAAQMTYERWNTKIDQDMKNAAQSFVAQTLEASRRLDGMTANTIERLQRNMDASRTEAMDRFLSRLREQLAPLLTDAQAALQNLAVSRNKLSEESRTIREHFHKFLQNSTQNSIAEVQEKALGMLDQFDSDIAKRLVECHDELQEKSVEIVAETARILNDLPQSCEDRVQGQLRSLVSSAADDVTMALKERTDQTPRQSSNDLDRSTWNYVELVGESFGHFPK